MHSAPTHPVYQVPVVQYRELRFPASDPLRDHAERVGSCNDIRTYRSKLDISH